MLLKKYKLRKKNDFKYVFENGKYQNNSFIRLKIVKNNQIEISRFGFMVSSKISKKAVERNKIRRRLERIVQLNIRKIKTGFDVIILAKPEINKKDYMEIQKDLVNLFTKINLIA